jgi:hypothetical protein
LGHAAVVEDPDIYIIREGYTSAEENLLIKNRRPIPGDFDEQFWSPEGIAIHHIDENGMDPAVMVFDIIGLQDPGPTEPPAQNPLPSPSDGSVETPMPSSSLSDLPTAVPVADTESPIASPQPSDMPTVAETDGPTTSTQPSKSPSMGTT